MNQNKELKIFNNPLGFPTDNIGEINIAESNRNAYSMVIKENVMGYLSKNKLPSHKELRIIEATNTLLSLIK